jgi:hypothetical protein
MSFEELLVQADSLRKSMDAAAQTSSLPTDVEPDSVDALVHDLMMSAAAPSGAVGV